VCGHVAPFAVVEFAVRAARARIRLARVITGRSTICPFTVVTPDRDLGGLAGLVVTMGDVRKVAATTRSAQLTRVGAGVKAWLIAATCRG